MKRHLVVALVALAAIPRLAAAQDVGWGPALRITPFVAISPNFKQTGDAVVLNTANNSVGVHDYELRFSSGVGMGIGAEYRLFNRFSVIGSGMWSSRGDGELIDFEDELIYAVDGTNLWMFKAGVSMQLREVEPDLQLRRMNAKLFLAPALIYDDPKEEAFTPVNAAQSQTHHAINMGAEAELPFNNNKMSFVLALEDYMVFWDHEDTRGRVEGTIQQRTPDALVAVEGKRSQIWFLRLGLTWRFM